MTDRLPDIDGWLTLLWAHGIGVRSDLPLPIWVFTTSAVAALVVSFLLLGSLWKEPRLEKLARGVRVGSLGKGAASAVLTVVVRAIAGLLGLVVFGVVLGASLFAPLGSGATIAPVTVFVIFWVAVPILVGLFGDAWRYLSPWHSLGWIAERIAGRFRQKDGQTQSKKPLPQPQTQSHSWIPWLGVAGVAAFLWLELAHPDPAETRLLGWGILIYTIVLVAIAAVLGRRRMAAAEGFGVLYAAIAKMGIFTADRKPQSSQSVQSSQSIQSTQIRLRTPMAGLANIELNLAGTVLVWLVLGSTTYDGFSGTRFWSDLVDGYNGWSLVPFSTLGLLGCVAAVALVFCLAIAVGLVLMNRRDHSQPFAAQTLSTACRFAPSLIPLLLAYSIAHYFSLLVFEGQDFIALLSDPLGRGWDLFGTAHFDINYRLVSTQTIALVQSLSIVVGHIGGVVVAHDKAVKLFGHNQALKSQVPLLVAMIGYTMVGLLILLNA